jgi:hydrogenase maturation protease
MTAGSADHPRVLVACVGNIFLGDDAFGVEVAQRLARRPLPEGVHVVDFGIRGLDLAYALLENYEGVVLVDALPRGRPPGTLYVLEPELGPLPSPSDPGPLPEPHNLDPARVLRLVAALGGSVRRLVVVGCEPEPTGDEGEMRMAMSDAVRAALDGAVVLVESVAAWLLSEVGSIPAKEVQSCQR